MKSGTKKINSFKSSDLIEIFSNWWSKAHHFVFIFLMIISMSLGIFFWYSSLYIPIMDDDEKSEYRKIKDKSVIFLEKDFNESVEYVSEREREINREAPTVRDVFK